MYNLKEIIIMYFCTFMYNGGRQTPPIGGQYS